MAKVIVPLPDRDFDTTEVAVPWKLLTKAGHEVIFATEHGAPAACDPLLLSGVIFGQLGAEDEPKRFYAELAATAGFQKPRTWRSLSASEFDLVVLPGGHAPGMRQYLSSVELQRFVAGFWGTGKPVGAICHGVLVLARTHDPKTGKSVLAGTKTTCLTKYMERTAYFLTAWKLGRYYRTYPAYVEDEVREAVGADCFVRGPWTLTAKGTEADDSAAFVVEDGRYVSARWPGDAYLFAKRLVERLAPAATTRPAVGKPADRLPG